METADVGTLQSGEWHLEIDAARGGQVRVCQWRGYDVFSPARRGAWPETAGAGCFPLVPFSNRIRQAAFSYLGQRTCLPAPEFAMPHALHGLGWRRAWSLQVSGPDELVMVQDNTGGAWPWPYAASQHLTVHANRLTLALSLKNTGTQTMPAGIGLHPYFPRRPGLALSLEAEGCWQTDGADPGIPTYWSALHPATDGLRNVSPDTLDLDNCFTGWSRTARLEYADPKFRIDLSASAAFSNLVIYCPAGGEALCLEPVSHVNDAANLSGLDASQQMDSLEPGDCLTGTLSIDVCEPA